MSIITVFDIKNMIQKVDNKATVWQQLILYYRPAKNLSSFDSLKRNLYEKIDSDEKKIYIQKLTCEIRKAVKLNINLDDEIGRSKLFELCNKKIEECTLSNKSLNSLDIILKLIPDLNAHDFATLKDRINS
jgi:hypothetical protein